ncbi:low molecular weight phosphatase family protein, partial [Mesorhizobium sp. M2D.F.Ca.ET.145.01.1.1]
MAGLTLAPGALPRSVLFLCGMNAVRSPMAEQLARRMLPPTIFVASAGVRAGERDPFVDAVLAEDGLTLGERHPRTLEDLEDDYFD